MAWYSPFESMIAWAHTKLNNVDTLKRQWEKVGCLPQTQVIYVENTAGAPNANEVIKDTLHFLYTVDPKQAYWILDKYAKLLINQEHYLYNLAPYNGLTPGDHPCDLDSDWANRIRICLAPIFVTDLARYFNKYRNTKTFDRYAKAIAAAYAITEDADAIDLDYAKQILAEMGLIENNYETISVPFLRWLKTVYSASVWQKVDQVPLYNLDFMRKTLSSIVNDDQYNSLMDFVRSKVDVSESEIHELYTSIKAYNDMKDTPDFDKEQFADTTAAAFRPDTPKADAKGAVILIMNSLECVDPEFRNMVNSYIDCGSESFILAPGDYSTLESELAIFEAAFLQNMENIATETYKPKPAIYEDDDEDEKDENDDERKSSNPDNDKDDIPMHGTAKLGGANGNIARSALGNKVRSKVYPLYATYKREQGKIDSQVSKIVSNAAKTLVGLDRDTMERRVLGANQFSILKTLKTLIGTYAIFSVSKLGGLILLITRMALRKGATNRERKKILNELENEIEIVDEKINDSRGNDDREAKYQLMRTKQNLETAVKKIKYAKTHYMTDEGLASSHEALQDRRGGM